AYISTLLNLYYTDEVIRPFSFDDLMDYNLKKITKFLSQFDTETVDQFPDKKTGFTKLILALLESIYSYYQNMAPKSINNLTKDGIVVVRDLSKLTEDINKEKLLIPPFQEYIITSNRNYQRYPFIVEYNGNFIISPNRLWMGYRLLDYALRKNRINNDLAQKYEVESMIEIEKRLKRNGVVIIGKEIKPSKHGGFEIDILGYYNEYILIIECKSFHPSPFFMMRKNRRYNDQFKDKLKRFDKIKTWIVDQLNKQCPTMEKIRIGVYDSQNKKPSEIFFPYKYHTIDQSNILYLYITQIKEYHEVNHTNFIQLWYGDL
ncbi:hypothetical protein LCGC14_2512060, partial [marine sediment metagenome]